MRAALRREKRALQSQVEPGQHLESSDLHHQRPEAETHETSLHRLLFPLQLVSITSRSSQGEFLDLDFVAFSHSSGRATEHATRRLPPSTRYSPSFLLHTHHRLHLHRSTESSRSIEDGHCSRRQTCLQASQDGEREGERGAGVAMER